jgi:hypothetical protein
MPRLVFAIADDSATRASRRRVLPDAAPEHVEHVEHVHERPALRRSAPSRRSSADHNGRNAAQIALRRWKG